MAGGNSAKSLNYCYSVLYLFILVLDFHNFAWFVVGILLFILAKRLSRYVFSIYIDLMLVLFCFVLFCFVLFCFGKFSLSFDS